MDATLLLLATLLTVPLADGAANAHPELRWQHDNIAVTSRDFSAEQPLPGGWTPAANLDEVVIRAQTLDSPYYDELPPPGDSGLPSYPYTPNLPGNSGGPSFPSNPYTPDPYTPFPSDPYTPTPYPATPAPYSPYPAGPSPYDPFLGPPADGGFTTYGANGSQPYRFGWAPRFDVGYITPADASGPRGQTDVFEVNAALRYSKPSFGHNIFNYTQQFNGRFYDGPATAPGIAGFPNNLYRFGFDFEYVFTMPTSPWSAKVAFNPSINSDFEGSLTSTAINYDARGAFFYQASPRTTVVLGALYWDRVDDYVLPYAGVIYQPNDRWELRLVFPDPQITYFAGHVWGKPMWLYARFAYNVEAYEVEVPADSRNQMQVEDFRFAIGAKKDQGWGTTFLEAGYVFDRQIKYARGTASGFDLDDAVLLRGGVEF